MDNMDRRGNWEKYDEHIRGRRRHDGRDPPGGRMAATASGRDRVGYPMAALRRLRASGGDRPPVRCGLQHSRRSCVLHSHIGLATFWAYQSYMGRPGQQKVVGTVLGAIGLVVFALLAESLGYSALSGVAVVGA